MSVCNLIIKESLQSPAYFSYAIHNELSYIKATTLEGATYLAKLYFICATWLKEPLSKSNAIESCMRLLRHQAFSCEPISNEVLLLLASFLPLFGTRDYYPKHLAEMQDISPTASTLTQGYEGVKLLIVHNLEQCLQLSFTCVDSTLISNIEKVLHNYKMNLDLWQRAYFTNYIHYPNNCLLKQHECAKPTYSSYMNIRYDNDLQSSIFSENISSRLSKDLWCAYIQSNTFEVQSSIRNLGLSNCFELQIESNFFQLLYFASKETNTKLF